MDAERLLCGGYLSSGAVMTYAPISMEELKKLGARITARIVSADSEPELYGELHANYPHEEWAMLRAPVWCGDKLVAVVVQPRTE